MVDLICEGACNPALPQFDAAAEVYAEARADGVEPWDMDPNIMTYLVTARTKLVYTPHSHRYGDFWACAVCRCERRYPAPLLEQGRAA